MSPLDSIKPNISLLKTVLAEKHQELSGLIPPPPSLRTLSAAEEIATELIKIFDILASVFKQVIALEKNFEQDFGSVRELYSDKNLPYICLVDDYLFPGNKNFPLTFDHQLQPGIITSYRESIEDWAKEALTKHQETQKWIQESFDVERSHKSLPCTCVDCVADYRTVLRATIFKQTEKAITDLEQEFKQNLEKYSFELICQKWADLYQVVDKNLNLIANKMKKGSINRIEKQLKQIIKDKFNYESEIGKKFSTHLKPIFKEHLDTECLAENFVSYEEEERFLHQLGVQMWRGKIYVKREYARLISSLLILKRKDVSSSVLQKYLGEFWLQSEARLLNRKIIYHLGPTNSGKTYHAIQRLAQVGKGCYLAPLRLLAGELYDTLNEMGIKTTLLTGEEVIQVPGATHYSSTIEMAKLHEVFECAVIDEIQMITDSQRGWAWTRALVNINSPEIHICGDASVLELVQKIIELTGDTLEIKQYERMTKLEILVNPITAGDLDRGDALIVFSRRNALKYKRDLEVMGFKVSIVYGRLSPEVRREQARKFDEGETDIIVSTDAIAMGMNLPIKRIVFSTLRKHIDDQEILISDSEIKQIAGRAGRYKRFPVGYVTCLSREEKGISMIQKALQVVLPQKTQAMVGPDLEIFSSVNMALKEKGLTQFRLSEFLRLFNTMIFTKPFYCVDLTEMIELAEMVESADRDAKLSSAESFGFACAPVNLGLINHVEYYNFILKHYVAESPINNEDIDHHSNDIDYLETSIKCVELYQWLARHFDNKGFSFLEAELLFNKSLAIERLNFLLSQKIIRYCPSCGSKLADSNQFNICEVCFKSKRFPRRNRPAGAGGDRNAPRDARRETRRDDRSAGNNSSPKKRFRPKSKNNKGRKFPPKR
jgi:ATP-dependent RNA helicase SUPV3L1/SUV3